MPIVLESTQNHAIAEDTEISPTIPASAGMGGGYVPMIVEPYVIELDATLKIGGAFRSQLEGRDKCL